jgi:hypothetical protein
MWPAGNDVRAAKARREIDLRVGHRPVSERSLLDSQVLGLSFETLVDQSIGWHIVSSNLCSSPVILQMAAMRLAQGNRSPTPQLSRVR